MSDLTKLEKDGITNNIYQRKTETPIPVVTVCQEKEIQISMVDNLIFITPKPASTSDGDDDSEEENVEVDDSKEENVEVSAISNCKQYIESSGSEIILTLPVDPHLPNIVYIKSLAAKAIPADATVSDLRNRLLN